MAGFLSRLRTSILVLTVFITTPGWTDSHLPYNAMGEKAGEVTPTSVILHTRLTENPTRNDDYSVPGANGRVRFELDTSPDYSNPITTDWTTVTPIRDSIAKTKVTDLTPGTQYYYRVRIRPLEGDEERIGDTRRFRTAPEAESMADVSFTVITGQKFMGRDDEDGHKSHDAMRALDPDFIVPTGDNVYYDNDEGIKGIDIFTCRFHWHRMYSFARQIAFFGSTSGYWEKDDHDYRDNDSDRFRPTDIGPSHEVGIYTFLEQHPIEYPTYRTKRWGKALQVWMLEGRDYRSNNLDPDGPEKSIWGAQQKAWLKQTILESDALFRVVISPTPLVGPDRTSKRDNHDNPDGFKHEGNEFFSWLVDNEIDNFYIACGDRHWQYHSIHPTGYQEFASGALSDQNLQRPPAIHEGYQRPYAKSQGGFLRVHVDTKSGDSPQIHFEHYSSDGDLNNRHTETVRE